MSVSDDFQRAVLRELDQIRAAFERTVSQLEHRAEERDSEVNELKLNVGLLREECRRNLKRDGMLVIAPTTLTAIITAVISGFGQPRPAPAQAPVARVEVCGDGVVQAAERCDDGQNNGAPGRCLPGCLGWGRVAP